MLTVMNTRSSCRDFVPHATLEPSQLKAIVDAANRAPSAGDLQAYRIVVVSEQAVKRTLASAALDQDFIAAASVVLVFCANAEESAVKYGSRGKALYCIQDATIACAYAQLAVQELGLGACWVGAFDEKEVEKALKLPHSLRPVALLPIGIPAHIHAPRHRKKTEELLVRTDE